MADALPRKVPGKDGYESDISFDEVVQRIRRTTDPFGRDFRNAQAVIDAMLLIREKILQGHLVTFGRKVVNLDYLDEMLALYPQELIPLDFWARTQFDYWVYHHKRTGEAEIKQLKFIDIHFDRAQIDRRWPPLPWWILARGLIGDLYWQMKRRLIKRLGKRRGR